MGFLGLFGTLLCCFPLLIHSANFGNPGDVTKAFNSVNLRDVDSKVYEVGLNFAEVVLNFFESSPEELLAANRSVNSDCLAQLRVLTDGENRDVLLQMADAWSKFPYTGILHGSRSDFGGFDQCIQINHHTTDAGTILGKQCTFGWIFPDISQPNSTAMIDKAWKLSYCVPKTCSAYDIGNLTSLPIFNEVICHTQEKKDLDAGAIVSIAIFAFFGVLIVLSTLYDLLLYKTNSPLAKKFILTAFSIKTNGKTLLSYVKHSKEQILCFHGLKFISMWWIMAGHNGVSWQIYTVYNAEEAAQFQQSYRAFYLMTGHLAVDTFFFISGFLLSYLYFKNSISKKPFLTQASAVPSMILHRYLRLTPAILMTYLFYTFIQPYLGTGPYYNYQSESLTKPCKDYWFAIFSYIQNYYNKDELCLTTLWYVCADMQLFLVSPLIIIPVALLNRKSYKAAMAALFSANVLFIALPIFTKLMWRDYDPNFDEFDAHARLSDYFIGVMMGLFVRHNKDNPYKLTRKLNVFLWIITLEAMFGSSFITQVINVELGYVAKSLTYSLTRPVWCLGLCWITYSSFTGHAGLIHKFLSNRVMQLGGKLTFSLYLVHGPLIAYFTLEIRERRIFNDMYMFYDWAGHFMLSMVLATILALSFEFPMVTVEKYIFGGKTRIPNKNKPKDPNTIQ